ncbi:hypothetical protein ABQY58_020205 [Xanthomonas hortorum pv. hederae]|uniref:methylation-associated defense system protein MAD7 n=1 Tax=Xanthomonas TaxID=338 RepID=UPI00057F9BCE|nr:MULTISPECIES: hypothetical protein [Xanthomonas]MBO9749056.1 hypothetical protein [Xanthomonas phaseoli pv. dieffenbachiae]ATS25138.1 hypothetical protein XppCFBP6164P_05755 [Xanthomonas phaseoli pv. phaseoli]KHS28030.1 hypothetical protein RM64_09025 [Xanthomonas phaseoli pv. phaseoli]KHS37013.1 hypothetical protein RN19_11860 [Xanthomonas phaseoli pv. phaseoli]MBO9742613.1 hypothetical protein [Xanthomonas phaseoli pv. phaseoli]
MALQKKDREFRLPKVSYLDFKTIEMDRVLTGLFERLEHGGYPSVFRDKRELTVDKFVDDILEAGDRFLGFAQHRDMVQRWVETHLMDIVNRGKKNSAVAGPRPLHGYTYRFRNPKHSRDYGAAQQLYQMLHHARHLSGHKAIEHLKGFFFDGFDKVTRELNNKALTDIETATLLHFLSQRKDTADTRAGGERFAPVCIGSADLMAEDIQRLLFYKQYMPRSVMVEYLKVLLSFHLALYHLRLLKLLPAWQKLEGANSLCAESACPMKPREHREPQGDCPYKLGMFVDLSGNANSATAALAERSADGFYRRIPSFIRAYFVAKKLDEFSEHLVRRGKLIRPLNSVLSVGELYGLQAEPFAEERDKFFGERLSGLLESLSEGEAGLDVEVEAITKMGLSDFETYIEILVALRGAFHRKYIIESLDATMLKNKSGGLLAQTRARNAPRRFSLESRLLEVLLQIAVLRPGGDQGYFTGEMRIDDLLSFLRERYGLYIDQLPPGEGFSTPTIDERKALRCNVQAFTGRLREIGFYRDLSDAYVTQTVVPRYTIAERTERARK